MEPALTLSAGCSKWDIRQKVWDYIEHKNLADFPRPVHHRIPNFKKSRQACQNISALEVFGRTREVKVDPDKPLEGVRLLALQAHKTLLVPTPRLRTGLFNRITPPPGASKEVLRICSTSQGVKDYSVPLGLDATVKVDLVVVGSVAVSEKGWRIGKGEGFADMEYAMMVAMGAVTEQTVVVTVVHDCQGFSLLAAIHGAGYRGEVLDFSSGNPALWVLNIPEELLDDHDLTVDYILTPTRVIKTDCTRPKPRGIIWSKISLEMMDKIPILKKLRDREQKAGKDVTLNNESGPPSASQAEGSPTAHNFRDAPNVPIKAKRGVAEQKDVTTVYIGNIPPATRVSEFKTVLREKGAIPLHLTWQGAQHRAFLDYADPCQAELVVSSLEGLNIGGQEIRVELARTQRSNTTGRQVFGERKNRSNNPRSQDAPNR